MQSDVTRVLSVDGVCSELNCFQDHIINSVLSQAVLILGDFKIKIKVSYSLQ